MRADLATALRSRNSLEASTIRTLIAAIENAGAVEAEPSAIPKKGLGHDVPRKELAGQDVADILRAEHAEVTDAMTRYAGLGRDDEVAEMRIRLRIIERYLG